VGANLAIGNTLFDGQTSITERYDVIDANSTQTTLSQRNSVTFLNDLNSTVTGFDNSDDVINGQGDNDTLNGKEGNDLLRGGAGDDRLLGAPEMTPSEVGQHNVCDCVDLPCFVRLDIVTFCTPVLQYWISR
jgi:Ca2+-binding RTX toxin-like protein